MTATQTTPTEVSDEPQGEGAPLIMAVFFGILAIPAWIFFILGFIANAQQGHPQGDLWYQKVITDGELALNVLLGIAAVLLSLAVTVSALMMVAPAAVQVLVSGFFGVATMVALILFMISMMSTISSVDNSWVRSQLAASTGEAEWTFPSYYSKGGRTEETLTLNVKNSLVVTSGSGEQLTIRMVEAGDNLWKLEYEPVAG